MNRQNGFTQHHFLYPAAFKKSGAGFIALMSAIIISVLLLAIILAVSLSGFFSRFNISDSESKQRSLGLAEACMDNASLSLIENPGATIVNKIVAIGSDQCTIVSGAQSTGLNIVKAQAVINQAYTNLRIIFDPSLSRITSWQECPNLTSSASAC